MMRPKSTTLPSNRRLTYFFAFVHNRAGLVNQEGRKNTKRTVTRDVPSVPETREPENDLGDLILAALTDASQDFPGEIVVRSSPKPFHDVRCAFDITDLPAVGMADFDLEEKFASDNFKMEERLPYLWNPMNLFRLKRIKQLKAERRFRTKIGPQILSAVTSDRATLKSFLVNLHIAHVDSGMEQVSKNLEARLRAMGLKKMAKMVSAVKAGIWP